MAKLESIEAKHDIILSREQQFAGTVAVMVIDKPALSAWMVLVPLLFLHYIHRYQTFRATARVFREELIFTKESALDIAFEVVQNGIPAAEALSTHFSGQEANYTKKAKRVHQKQLKEIEILIPHYVDLLRAKGDSYESLVKNVYRNRDDYSQFLNRLQRAEKEVNLEAMRVSNQAEGFSEIISKMETAIETLRKREIAAIFS